jgi:hypothetical protein
VADPVLPPSRFGAGYTVGAPAAAPAATAPFAFAGPAIAGANSVVVPAARVNRLAVLALVAVLLLGPFVALLTIALSLTAGMQIKRSGQGGAGLAKAALAISCIYLVFGIVVTALAVLVVHPGWLGPA